MLAELENRVIDKTAAKYRRRAIAYVLCGVFLLAALYQASIAALLAMEPEVGAVGARLILAAFYAAAAGATALVLRYKLQCRDAQLPDTQKKEPEKLSLAMIVEAVLLGYSWSRGGSLAERRER
jgi:hypothetical protein